jgi:predicted transcriptional regulator
MLGFKCVPYINTAAAGAGKYTTPTWTALTLSRDVEIADSRNEADGSDRGSDQESISTAQRKVSFTMELRYKPGNAGMAALIAAYKANTPVDLFFADAPGGVGAAGVRGDFALTTCTKKMGRTEKVLLSVAGGRTNDEDHEVVDYTYPAP